MAIAKRALAEGYTPAPYAADADETVACPECGRGNDTDAGYCDQCGYGPLNPTAQYARQDDENVECPNCELMNDGDAHYCDQCGIRLENRQDVVAEGADDDDVDGSADTVKTDDQSNAAKPTGEVRGTERLGDIAPRSNLVRARSGAGSAQWRAAAAASDDAAAVGEGVLFGIFSEFNTWYEINSFWEGTFLERMIGGAFAETIVRDRSFMSCMYEHGWDTQQGSRPLGPIDTLEERAEGPYYEVLLSEQPFVREYLIPQLQGQLVNGRSVGSLLGASFRFSVDEDSWAYPSVPTTQNPAMLPERTVLRCTVYEFGPVSMGANPGATSGMRSRSDEFLRHVATDPEFLLDLHRRTGRTAERLLAAVPSELRRVQPSAASAPERTAEEWDTLRLRAQARLRLAS